MKRLDHFRYLLCEKDKEEKNELQITKQVLSGLNSEQTEELQTCVSKFLQVLPNLFE